MHSWAEVVGTNLTGLAAADGVCQARARAAGLQNPGEYVAWLSDRNNDAYCRVFGLSGKKANNCGLPLGLPLGAGPWLRTDNVPFAGVIEEALADNVVYSTLNVDEFGNRFHTWAQSFTATDIDGTFNRELDNDADCNLWSSSSRDLDAFPTLGSNLASGGYWTFDDSGVSCDGTRRLMCMQKGSGSPVSGHAQFGHREAFVTSADVTGNLGGILGADQTCKALAASANLYRPESFKALLASFTLGLNVTERIQIDGPWYRRDGLLFAHNKAELVGGAVTLPLNVTENGSYLGLATALTGAFHNGAAISGFDCGAWTLEQGATATSAALVNSIAFAPSGGTRWLDVADVSCGATAPTDWPHKLFCLSDADVIFHSELEALPASP